MYNLLSLLLGLVCLAMGLQSVRKRGSLLWTAGSLGLCSASILCQLIDLNNLTAISDWSAIADTTNARVYAGSVLLAVTITLNLLALLRSRKNRDSCF